MSKRYAIFYFSGTGNTWWAADQIALRLNDLGWEGETFSIETLSPKKAAAVMEGVELVLFGYPVYASDLPLPMWEFLEALPDRDFPVQPAGVFCTQMMFSGDGAILPRKLLGQKGFRQGWAVHIKMPNNICVSGFPFRFYADPLFHEPLLEKAARRILKLCLRLDVGRPWLQGRGPFWTANAQIQRKPYRKYFAQWRDDLSVDRSQCILCGRCAEICPVNNISIKDNTVKFAGQCVLCVRCYNFCPTQAILYRGREHKQSKGKPFQGPVRTFRPELLRKTEQKDS